MKRKEDKYMHDLVERVENALHYLLLFDNIEELHITSSDEDKSSWPQGSAAHQPAF